MVLREGNKGHAVICRVMGNFVILSSKKVIKSKKTRWIGHVTSVVAVAYTGF
jgi:hypothetical protein